MHQHICRGPGAHLNEIRAASTFKQEARNAFLQKREEKTLHLEHCSSAWSIFGNHSDADKTKPPNPNTLCSFSHKQGYKNLQTTRRKSYTAAQLQLSGKVWNTCTPLYINFHKYSILHKVL